MAESKAKDAESERDKISKRLEAAKVEIVELKAKLAPRQLTQEQRTMFINSLSEVPKGKVNIVHVSLQAETMQFVGQISSMLKDAGFLLPVRLEYNLSYVLNDVRAPWLMPLIVGGGDQAPYAVPIKKAFLDMGIDVLPVVGDKDISSPGDVKIYIGSR